jgi:hypothetical protein
VSNYTSTAVRKAHKEHRCSWCYEPILPGETYHRYRVFDDGPGTIRLHAECYAVIAQVPAGLCWTEGTQPRGVLDEGQLASE